MARDDVPGRVEQPAAWSRLCQAIGLWSLVGHTACFLLLWAGAGVGALWAWFLLFPGGSWPLTRLAIRSRSRLDRLERGFMLNWAAAEVTRALLFALFCPPGREADPERVALVYPAFAAVRGLLWVVQARQFWGRFLLVGFVCFLVAPALIPAGVWAPLVFGVVNAACLLWLAGSALLSWYLSNFANYTATYGSLGAAIGLMTWMWMSAIIVLCGAELNSVIERRLSPLPPRPEPFGNERRLPSRSRLVGAWVAMSPTASSFSTRLRGTSRDCASCSRQAATSISTARSFGLRTRVLSRSQARSGWKS